MSRIAESLASTLRNLAIDLIFLVPFVGIIENVLQISRFGSGCGSGETVAGGKVGVIGIESGHALRELQRGQLCRREDFYSCGLTRRVTRPFAKVLAFGMQFASFFKSGQHRKISSF